MRLEFIYIYLRILGFPFKAYIVLRLRKDVLFDKGVLVSLIVTYLKRNSYVLRVLIEAYTALIGIYMDNVVFCPLYSKCH